MISRMVCAAALVIVSIAALAVVPSASAAPATLTMLKQTDGVLYAEWTRPDATVLNWQLEISQNPSFTPSLKSSHAATIDVFIGTNASPPGTYWFRVITTTTRSDCELGNATCVTEVSNALSVTIPPPPSNPANLVGLTQSGGVLSASWTLPAGVASWEIEVGTSPSVDSIGYFNGLVTYADLDPGQTTATTEQLPPGTYYVHIISTPSLEACWWDVNDPLCFLDFSNIRVVTVPPPAPSPPPPPPPAPDKVLSLGAVTASSSQDVDKLSITLNPGEAVNVKLSGSVSVPGASKVFRFKTVDKSLGAGKAKLSLKLATKAKKAVKRALKRKKKLKAKLTLVVTDAAGNSQTKKYSVRLKP